jgi:photosystem II stability/assembly factor-like uncharacterized protein
MKKTIFLLLFIHCSLVIANAQWVLQSSGTEQTLQSVYFVDKHTGWAVGDNGTILKSVNGGKKWKNYGSNSITANLYAVRFINEKTGWCVGDNGVILKTKDKGKNWSLQYSGSSNMINSIFFVNSQKGWCVGDGGLILKTTNAGTNWLIQTGDGAGYFSVYFINRNTGWICGGSILKTTNGGVNWLTKSSSWPEWHSIHFVNSLTGWTVGRVYSVGQSTDGGENWIRRTINNLETDKSPPVIHTSVYFINSNTGWFSSAGFAGVYRGRIHKTTNGGLDWLIDGTCPDILLSINFSGPKGGWAVGENGTILKLTNDTCSTSPNFGEDNLLNNYSLSQNYPNPFNPSTNIKYAIPNSGFVKLIVLDLLGREVETLINEKQNAGTYEATFNASRYPSGVYFYRLITEGFIDTKKMLLVK